MRSPVTTSSVKILVSALLLTLTLLTLPGCGGRPDTPEALWAKLAELNEQSDVNGIWALYAPEGQEKQRRAINGLKKMLRDNPAPKNFENLGKNQFGVQTLEEFTSLGVVELITREHEFRGLSKLMVGAEILDVVPNPESPQTEMDVRWKTQWGDTFSLIVKRLDDGWGMIEQSRVGSAPGVAK